MPKSTYGKLYTYLGGLGFRESSRSALGTVWQHRAVGIVLLFSKAAPDEAVRGADLLSAEVRLQHYGMLEGSILSAIQGAGK